MHTARVLPAAPRRGLRLQEAALYVGVGKTKFLELVNEKIMPAPTRKCGVVLWDIRALDLAFDALASDADDQGGEDTWADFGGDG